MNTAQARFLENIPLVWKPTTGTASAGVIPGTSSIQINPFADRRSNPALQNGDHDSNRAVLTRQGGSN